ncbi:ISP domain-containing protein [Coccomyxa subellipsoidea C-169]|uniref:ISP domain-containing protein n=1 Tax=Coccomyxa subellipsoidea (strain C-169) TaxID=574566 RepID=I0YYD6_COCSC|nr:ISP domain-containing protein [Coccomyxa subellipsoidea C-169]EIE23405.1 ISP domain-containing protein [Coccomyxa subellipsoidea C-169]|eukprot:XP_005647949.1 ISP domain-containing protein [Coccomyxa subellipsoidea C-169]
MLQESSTLKRRVDAVRAAVDTRHEQATAHCSPIQTSTQEAANGGTFDWARQWYPLAFVEDLDPGRPHAMELLGKRLVIWYDSRQHKWTAFEDRCPHRLAPLSEGRIEPSDGTLMCSYHGWRFRGDGACTRIPQALDARAEDTACSSGRSCAAVHPTQVSQGYVWVWGDCSASAAAESALMPPLLIPELSPDDTGQATDGGPVISAASRYARDLPYSWDVLVENFLDPSHVSFAHHGVQGNRESENVGVFEISPTDRGDPMHPPQEAISMDVKSAAFGTRGGKVKWSQMPMFVVPTGPGRSRVLWWLIVHADGLPAPFRALAGLKPRWADHLTRNLVFDGDNIILHIQERVLAEDRRKGGSWRRSYFMPTQADRIVTAFRQWFEERAGGGPIAGNADADRIEPSRAVLLDRYSSHTRHCKSCSQALGVAKVLQVAVTALAVLSTLGLAYWVGSRGGQPPLVTAGIFLLAAASTAATVWLRNLVQKFYFVDYVHADKH